MTTSQSRRKQMNELLTQFVDAADPHYCIGYFFQTLVESSINLNDYEYKNRVAEFKKSIQLLPKEAV